MSGLSRVLWAIVISSCLCPIALGAPGGKPGLTEDVAPWTDVRTTGAKGDGIADDTAAIHQAIAQTPAGGMVLFPAGKYRITNQFVINKPLTIAGVGAGSQIFQAFNGKSIFILNSVKAATIRDLWLGSASSAVGSSLITLINSHHNRIDRVIMLGGYYGIYLKGSLLNTFVDLKSGNNFADVFFAAAQTSTNQFWVFGERYNDISANANSFFAPTLEGGTNGIRLEDTNGEGSLFVYGGTIEGVDGYGIYLQGVSLPSIVSGVHMELNTLGDVYLAQSSHIRLQSLLATTGVWLAGVSKNNTVSESLVEKIVFVDSTVVRTRLLSNEMNLSGNSNPAVQGTATDTQYMSVSQSINPFDWYGTTGIGIGNPNSNPMGSTPNLKLDVKGTIRADAHATGDIHFYKDGKHVQRLFEDEAGLYLENTETGAVSRIFLESDLDPIDSRLKQQQRAIEALESQLIELRRALSTQ